MKYSQYPVADELNATDLIALSQFPHTAEENTFKTVTPVEVTNYVNENAQLESTGQVTGLNTALDTKVNKAGDSMTGALTLAGDPTSALQAAPKQYVDAQIALAQAGFSVKASCRVLMSGSFNAMSYTVDYDNGSSGVGATITLNAPFTSYDGVTFNTNDRICINSPISAEKPHNGIYVYTSSTVLTRAADYDNSLNGEINTGSYTIIAEGDANKGKFMIMNKPQPITVGTSDIVFTAWTLIVAGNGITLTGNIADLDLAYANANIQLPSTAKVTGLDTALSSKLGVGNAANPTLAAFLAFKSSSENLAKNQVNTLVVSNEVLDQGNNFSANTFTAPVSGLYYLNASVRASSFNGATRFFIGLSTSNVGYSLFDINPNNAAAEGNVSYAGSVLAYMDAGDTATVYTYASGGSSTYTINSSSGETFFAGHFVC